ncbi:39954_t:CDS:2, partial [Gigaspora margarita]
DDIPDFLAKLRLYLQNQGVNPANNAAGPPTGRELEKAEDISEHLLLDKLAKKLYEIELCRIARHKRDRIPDLLVSQQ